MQDAADFVVSFMQTVKEVGDALTRIEDRVNTTANEINMIATASEDQSATTIEMRTVPRHSMNYLAVLLMAWIKPFPMLLYRMTL